MISAAVRRTSASSSSARPRPRARNRVRSPRARRLPDEWSWATITSAPSAESWRRSRNTASAGSPRPRPSTNTTPASTVPCTPQRAALELEHVAVVGHVHARRLDAHLLGQLRVRGEHAHLAVHRNERARMHQREQRLELVRRAVTRDVHGRDLLVQHGRARAAEGVHRVVHRKLVAGHRLGGHDDGVAALDADDRVVVEGDPGERRQRLALGAGAQQRQLAGRVVVEVAGLDERCRRRPARSRGCGRC